MSRNDLTSRTVRFFASLFLTGVVLAMGLGVLVYHPKTPLPPEWNPVRALNPAEPVTLVTGFKLQRSLASPAACSAALQLGGAAFTEMSDEEQSAVCHIRGRRSLLALSGSRLRPVETTCDTALRLLMWEIHSLQPAAQKHFGVGVRQIDHFGSFSCRRIRGSSTRMSQHATASAIDVAGVRLENGRRVNLLKGWNGSPDERAFLREIRDGGCEWFRLTLSPDYNALHADHFHFEQGRWPGCR